MTTDTTVEYSALNWVKKELDAVLHQARVALEGYIEHPDNAEALNETLVHLRQVHGTLQMVELYGAAMLSEEMQAAVQALIDGSASKTRDETLEVLMRSVLQLPDYLEHVQTGHGDIPIVLLPLLNDLRSVRGAGLLSESVLFFPDLEAAPSLGMDDPATGVDIIALSKRLRHGFQLALLGWFRDRDVPTQLQRIADIVQRLRDAATPGPTRNFWWIVGALSESLANGGLSSGATLKHLFGRIDRALRAQMEHGEQGLLESATPEFTRSLLYYVATAPDEGEQVMAVKRSYRLGRLLPAGAALDEARESLGGANLELLNTVCGAIREDLAEVKDQIELFMRADTPDLQALKATGQRMQRIGDTIGMLGIGEPREIVLEQAALIEQIADGAVAAEEPRLLEVAGAMLRVEAQIDDFLSAREHGRAPVPLGQTDSGMATAEYRNVVGAAIREVLTDINKAKEAILEFISSPADRDVLRPAPAYLARVRRALGVLPVDNVTPLLQSIESYITIQVLESGAAPSTASMDALADAITSVEFYLESLRDERGEYTQILEVGKQSVARLGYPAGQPPTAESPRPQVEAEPVAAEPAAPKPTPTAVPRPAVLAGEVDEEILEIFLEEAEEEIERIGEYLPRWEANLSDEDALTTVRRSFHTLKGSGRLVGAMLIGEFAWAFESLLNRVIDKTIAADPHVFEALHKAHGALPQLVRQVRGEGEPEADIDGLMEMARAMSKPDFIAAGALEEESEADRTAYIEGEDSDEPTELVDAAPPPDEDADPPTEVAPIYRPDADTPAGLEARAGGDSTEATRDEVPLDVPSHEAETIELPQLELRGAMAEEPEEVDSASTMELPAIDEIDFELDVGADLDEASDDQPEPRMDPVLLGIFKAEAEQHLQSIDLYLQEAPIDHHGRPVTKELLRALHTMNGTARTADVPELWQIYGPLEAYAKERDGNDLVMPEKALTVLQDASDYARSLLTGLEAGVRYLPDNAAILTEIEALRADDPLAPPAPAPVVEEMEAAPPPIAATVELPPEVINARADMPGEQDMELVDIFLEEADEIMNASDATLQRWKENHEDRDAVSEFQRQLHTLKGGARMAGFSNIGHLSHAVESLTIAVVDGVVAPTGGMFDHLHQAMDRLSGMLDSARSQKPVQPAPELLTELERLRLGLGESTEPGEPAVEVELQVEAAPPPPVEEPEDPELGAPPLAEETPQAHEDEAADVVDLGAARENRAAQQEPRAPRAAPQELVRVRSDLLDNLVNYAGEVNIYHSRLEQQISGFRFNLGELEQTVHRLREQLRKLELETEAQIRSSYEREREREGDEVGVADFDPLELDRYSNIQQLSRALAESLNDLVSIEDFLGEQVRDAETLLLQQSRVSTDLQEGLMRTRMVQFTGMVPRLRRIVRQTAGELGRKVELNISGEGSELDRSVLERMIAPMEHMLRNAISHGIESPQERAARGKPEQGEIEIELGREGSEVVIRVSDDGAGINLEAVRAKARRMGLLESDTHLSDSDVMQLIMEPGFSTAQEVSQISGRGVGMDVVNSEIKQLNGSLQIESVEGKGTVFTIRLPFTLAINQALLVQTAEDLFAIPLTSIEGIVRYSTGDLRQKYEMENPLIDYAAHTYELKHLGTLFGVSTPSLDADNLFPVLLVRSGNQRIALQVEGLLGSREVVVKSVGPQIAQARGISGATILGDGRVVLILDIPALIRMGMGVRSVNQPIAEPDEADEEARRLTVMVVDDSITIRKVTSRMLERNDFGVMTAKDGVDAVAQLQEQIPDLMLLDIEMPRMDGYELAQHVRNDPRLHDIPIIMITSRTGEKHRQRALDIGVNRYLGKPYQEGDLLENIQEVLGTQGELQGTSD